MEFSRGDVCDLAEAEAIEESGQYIDDLKGSVLDSKLTRVARAEEVGVFYGEASIRCSSSLSNSQRSEAYWCALGRHQ